jgi:hypothetical protein
MTVVFVTAKVAVVEEGKEGLSDRGTNRNGKPCRSRHAPSERV